MVPATATDITVHVEASHWPEKPFQARVSYLWQGQPMSWVRYYLTRAGAARAARNTLNRVR